MPLRPALVLALVGLLNACNSANHIANDSGLASPPEGDAPAPTWVSIDTKGDTLCSDGSPYRFFYHAGARDKLMVYLQGGGGCWNRQTCDPAMQPSYTINIDNNFTPPPVGIFDFANSNNPFKDYSIVMAPYCTGDVHLGASDTVYPPVTEDQEPLTIHHRGRANVQATLDWTYAKHLAPAEIFVTGSSAGAIPSPYYAALLADHYSSARIAQLGDAAGGYRRSPNNSARPHDAWGTFNFLTDTPGFSNLKTESFNYEALYISAAKAHPDIQFAQYDAAHDAVQKRFLGLTGDSGVNLLTALRANHADIRREAENFRSFISGGTSHTVLLRPTFYTFGAAGQSVRNWVAQLAAFESVDDIVCSQCQQDTFVGTTLRDAALSQQYLDGYQRTAVRSIANAKATLNAELTARGVF